MTLYLSRLKIAERPDVDALKALLDPRDAGARADAHHRLIWSAFAGDAEATRDFLWRTEGKRTFLTLSARPPAHIPMFEPPEVKPFTPDLAAGDRLCFSLRANATKTQKTGTLSKNGREKKRHVDVVMNALYPHKQDRAARRDQVAQEAGKVWIEGQGARGGFDVTDVVVRDYSVQTLPGYTGKRRGQPQYGILSLEGRLTVTDPALLLARMAQGFGRAKAFGCGLMLIRRAP